MDLLGAHWDGERTRFAVHSADAEAVVLELFEDETGPPRRRVRLEHGVDDVWSAVVEDAPPGTLYAYRAEGPWDPARGLRFNASKLLIDPIARAVTGEPRLHDALFACDPAGPPDAVPSRLDSAPHMPRCVVVDPALEWQGVRPPRTAWRDTVIYEAHVRGLTRLHPGVPEKDRGTYRGVASAAVVEHLRGLGVTAIELLPIQQIASEPHLQRRGLNNYWGYSPLAFCAPHAGYASGARGEQVTDLQWMVRELHRAGIEVLLDVVFNHTSEGHHTDGPTLSLRGLDNRSYYLLDPDSPRRDIDLTGCGNTLDIRSPAVRRLVLDSLRVWVRDFHIDGFRFDLGTVVGRGAPDGSFDAASRFFEEVRADPELADVKWIAEPWDVGLGGYQLGRFPAPWAEWNDQFRDTARAFWRGDGGLADLATRLAGSRDLFHAKGPLRSIHFVTCHDGFTLDDLVSYEHKHNEANGEANRDGHDHNLSRNWGVEGPSDHPEIRAARSRAKANLLVTTILSQGVPMLLAGDELGHSQDGNNNAYCQDNPLSWLDWNGERSTAELVRRLLEIRRDFPQTRREDFPGTEELRWWHPSGRDMEVADWHDGSLRAMAIVLRALADGDRHLVLFVNGGPARVVFDLPEPDWSWTLLVDTESRPAAATPPKEMGLLRSIEAPPYSMKVYAAA